MAVLIMYVLFNLFFNLLFFKFQKKNLHVLEILTYWFVTTFLFQNYSAFFFMNLKYFIVPEDLSLEMAHFINRTVLYPIVAILFLNRFVLLRSIPVKFAAILLQMLIFAGLEWLEHTSGVLMHIPEWQVWWSVLYWLLFLLMSTGFQKYFRMKLTKGIHTP
jgi:hypothetical protein